MKSKKLPLRLRAEAVGFKHDGNDLLVLCGMFQDGSLGFPGGGVEIGESVAHAAARELREECGWVLGKVLEVAGVKYQRIWEKPRKGRESYSGSETRFAVGVLESAVPKAVGPDGNTGGLKVIQLIPACYALAQLERGNEREVIRAAALERGIHAFHDTFG